MDEKIELIHTMAYQQFIPLFVRAGLEIDENEECPEGLITCLELKDCRTEKTVGAAVLVYTENVYVMKAVAVKRSIVETDSVCCLCGKFLMRQNVEVPIKYF